MMSRNKFISFLIILNFVFIEGDKGKKLRKLQKTLKNLEESDDIENLDDDTKSSDNSEELPDDIKKDNVISQVEDIPLPETYVFGFSNYKFYENPYMFQYDIVVRIANYPINEINNITMNVDLVTSKSEEECVTCIKTRNMSSDIYRFVCSKEVSEPVSQISYINNTLILNGKIPLNSSISEIAKLLGKNIQLQTKNIFSDPDIDLIFFKNCYVYGENNKLMFKGETYGSAINSKDSTLSFVQGEDIKNIVCIINDEGNNNFQMICKPNFNVNSDLSNNNAVYIDDIGKNGMMFFEEGKSLANLVLEDNSETKFISNSSSESTKGIIVVIIILFIVLIVIIIIIIILCKSKNGSKQENQENNESQISSHNDLPLPPSETTKEKRQSIISL
jgi:hypothetical protein